MRNSIIFWLIVLVSAIALNSCGARKKESSKKEELTKTELHVITSNSDISEDFRKSDLNVKVSSVTKVDDQNEKTTIKKTFTPLNPNLPANFVGSDGKKYDLYNAVYNEETIVEKNNTKSENSNNSDISDISELTKKDKSGSSQDFGLKKTDKKKEEAEKLDREAWNFSIWFWLLIASVIFLFLRLLNKRFHVTSFIAGLFQIRKK